LLKLKADNEKNRIEQERIERESNNLKEELDAYNEEMSTRRIEYINAINDIRNSIGAKADINYTSIENLFKDSEVTMNQEQKNFNGTFQAHNQNFSENGAINNNNSTSTFTQNNNFSDIEKVIHDLKSNLDKFNLSSENKEKVLNEIQTIEAIAQTSNPKKEFLKQSFQTIRNILEGISASVVAHNLVTSISALTLFK
jgi:signal recognition particle GTPase